MARELVEAGWRLERVLTDNGNEFGRRSFGEQMATAGIAHSRIRAGRPQTNGHVERLHRTILEECWRPAFCPLLAGSPSPVWGAISPPTHRPPADLVYGARKMESR